jgi:hypothetical protein
MLYLGFVVNPIVNIHVVIFCVKTLFSQLDSEDGGCMFFSETLVHRSWTKRQCKNIA